MNSEPMRAGPYTIPAGHMIMPSLTAIMKGPDQWEDALAFKPSRFIDPNSGRVVKNEKLIPFSTGKRQCPGETLAKAEIFLFFVGLLQRYRLEPVDPSSPPDVEMISGVTSYPKPYRIKVVRAC